MADVLGLEVPVDVENGRQVISALIIVKTFDPESDTGMSHQVTCSDDLTVVDAVGLLEYALIRMKKALYEL